MLGTTDRRGNVVRNAQGPAATRLLLGAGGVVWLLALYALSRPYRGVRHDAQLYFMQAQSHLTPDWVSHDLFFQFGSQDRYTIFSRLFAPILRAWGLQDAEIGTLLVLHGLFWFASWLLLRKVASDKRWGMLAVVAVLPHFYGSFLTFSFMEPFLTARTLAEPLCVLGLAALLNGRYGWMLLALLLALMSHPLIAIPAWVLVWFVVCERDRRWLWAAAVVVGLALVGAVAGIAPLDGLLKSYDAEWSHYVHESNAFNFFAAWDRAPIAQALFDFGLLLLGALDRQSPLRPLYRASFVTALVLCALSALLADGLNLVFPTQLQLWRSLWLAHYLALLALLPVAATLWRRNEAGRLAAAMIMVTTVLAASNARMSWVFVLAALFVSAASMRDVVLRRSVAVLGIAACALGAAVMAILEALQDVLILVQHVHTGEMFGKLEGVPAAIPQLMLVVLWFGVVWPARSVRRWVPAVSLGAGLIALWTGTRIWDQRDDFGRYIESHYDQPNPFRVELPPYAQVYWPKELLASWALLKRPIYVSLASNAAAVYGREEIMEAARRWKVVQPMTIQIDDCIKLVQEGHADYKATDCKYTDAGIRDVCRAPGGPDDVVLMNPLQRPPLAVWNYQPPGRPPEPFYLYDCHRF
jgi:hypothetical protein